MYEQIAEEYREVQRNAQRELEKAALVTQVGEPVKGGTVRRTRVHGDENAPVIPAGATIAFKAVELCHVKPGSFVFLRRGGDFVVRRLVRTSITPAGLLMHVATARGPLEDPIPQAHLLGRVVEVQADGRTYDPARFHGGLKALADSWTEFGTCNPGTKLLRTLAMLLPARLRPKL